MTGLPLAGRRILVTRAPHQAGKLSDALRAAGAEPVEVPVLEILPPASYDPLDRALQQLGQYDWLILTSVNAVGSLTLRAGERKLSTLAHSTLKVAAIGASTADAARHAGLNVALVPDTYLAESLLDCLLPNAANRRFLIVRAAVARDVIPGSLREAGAQVDVVDAYRNALPASAPEELRKALAGQIDAVTFTSSSSVTRLAEASHLAGIRFPVPGLPAISIGPITSQTLREMGWTPAAEAKQSDIDGLVHAAVDYFKLQPESTT